MELTLPKLNITDLDMIPLVAYHKTNSMNVTGWTTPPEEELNITATTLTSSPSSLQFAELLPSPSTLSALDWAPTAAIAAEPVWLLSSSESETSRAGQVDEGVAAPVKKSRGTGPGVVTSRGLGHDMFTWSMNRFGGFWLRLRNIPPLISSPPASVVLKPNFDPHVYLANRMLSPGMEVLAGMMQDEECFTVGPGKVGQVTALSVGCLFSYSPVWDSGSKTVVLQLCLRRIFRFPKGE